MNLRIVLLAGWKSCLLLLEFGVPCSVVSSKQECCRDRGARGEALLLEGSSYVCIRCGITISCHPTSPAHRSPLAYHLFEDSSSRDFEAIGSIVD